MTTEDSSVPVVVDRVHTGPEATWDRSAGWRPVAGVSAVWDG
jgi:hypothetical protein